MSKSPSEKSRVGCAHQGSNGGHNTPTDPIAAEIQAEIADHLATATEKLQSQGLPTAEANEKSKAKFGDADLITRRCYWIKQGDALMFRTATIVLLTLLCCALGMMAFNGYRSQRQMAEEMAALAKQLQILAERQQTPAPAPTALNEPKPLEVTGNVFFGTPDQPAINTEVMICRASDGEIARRVSTDEGGAFQSGPLAAGDYTLVAKGVKGSPRQNMGIQSAPLYVYPGMPSSDNQIDATYRAGHIAVELSRPLPTVEVEGKYKIDSRLYIAANTTQTQSTRWTAAHPIPGRWPIYITLPDLQARIPNRGNTALSGVVSNAELDASMGGIVLNGYRDLPIGPCSFVAAVFADVLPTSFAVASQLPPRDSSSANREKLVVDWMSKDYVLQQPMGAVWLGKLKQMSRPDNSNLPRFGTAGAFSRVGISSTEFFQTTELVARAIIGDSMTTRLRIEIPDDLESLIERLLETATDPTEFEQAVREDSPFIRQAKITVLDSEQHDQAGTK